MGRVASRRGQTSQGSRGHEKKANSASTSNNPSTSFEKSRGCKSTSWIIKEVTTMHHARSTHARQLISKWEEELNEIVGLLDLDLDDWHTLVPNKWTMHLYWLLKILVVKALNHIPPRLAMNAQALLGYSKDFQQIKFKIQQQSHCLSRSKRHIPCIPQSELPRSSVKDPTLVDSKDDE